MEIILKSKLLKVTKIKKKSSAKMLKGLKVDDVIQLSVDASPVGRNRGTYASYIRVENVKTKEANHFSFNQIDILERNFELEECENYVLEIVNKEI
jgi:hypothetical protein